MALLQGRIKERNGSRVFGWLERSWRIPLVWVNQWFSKHANSQDPSCSPETLGVRLDVLCSGALQVVRGTLWTLDSALSSLPSSMPLDVPNTCVRTEVPPPPWAQRFRKGSAEAGPKGLLEAPSPPSFVRSRWQWDSLGSHLLQRSLRKLGKQFSEEAGV